MEYFYLHYTVAKLDYSSLRSAETPFVLTYRFPYLRFPIKNNSAKKVLILCAHRPGRSPSQRFRFEQYLSFLAGHGYQFTFSALLNQKNDRRFYSAGNVLIKCWIMLTSLSKRLREAGHFGSFDLIFIQREAYFLGTSLFERLAYRSGARVIFDFDDAIWLEDTSPGNQKWRWVKRPEKFFRNIRYAHAVIAGNEILAEKARAINKNTVLIPSTIDTALFRPMPERRNGKTVVIGWSGSVSTVKHFEMLIPVLVNLKKRYGDKIIFRVIGQGSYSNALLPVEALTWSPASEVAGLNGFDIGIMPLPDNEWTRGKCGLKALSYMACGIPVVASPVGVNAKFIRHGHNGFLAENDSEWYYLLCALIEDPETRTAVGLEGRKTVEKEFSVDANREKYLEVFNAVLSR
jgi:glycosyltransferase involved in cell wall biosynthesis